MGKTLHAAIYRLFSRIVPALFFIFSAAVSFGQVKFSASSNGRVIGKNDYLQVDFTVENAGTIENFNPPSFKNFTIVSGPNNQSSMTSINGNVKQSISVSFVLQPISTGKFTIDPAVAQVNGKEFRSNPLSIQVTNSSSSRKNAGSAGNSLFNPFGNMTLDFPTEPATHQFDDYILKKGENVAEKIKKNLFIRIEASKKSCYVGEPLVATYKLYTRLKSESNVTKAPSFNGFSVSELEMPDNQQLRTEKYNGREYNVYTLRKVQLYPLQAGTPGLEPVEVKNNITFLKAEYAGRERGEPFYDMLRDFANGNASSEDIIQETVTVSCDTLKILVKPLPDAGKPASFKGAVGNFTIAASLEKNNFSTEDAGSLKVVISGAGNFPLVNAPAVSWSAGMEGFESKASENLDKLSVPLKGDKVFVYPFTVANAGDYTIPPIEFSYFDITSQSYRTIRTQPVAVHVEKGTGSQKTIGPANNNKNENKIRPGALYSYRYYLGGGIMLLSAIIAFVAIKRRGKKAVSAEAALTTEEKKKEENNEFVIPVNPLAPAEERLLNGDSSGFFKTLDVSFHKYLSQKLKVPAEELTHKKINERMDKYGVGVGTTLLVNSLLEDIEINLYAPASSEALMQEVYEKASEVVSLLDKQVC